MHLNKKIVVLLLSMIPMAWLGTANNTAVARGYSNNYFFQQTDTIPTDTTAGGAAEVPAADSIPTIEDPIFIPRDRFGDPFSEYISPSPLLKGYPSGLDLQLEIDTALNFSIYERMGDINYRPPSILSFDEYSELMEKELIKSYWRTKSAELDGEGALGGRRLIPKIPISPVFDRIFGGSFVDIQPNGSVTLDFGGRFERIFNPSIPIRRQKTGTFDFDQRIGLNVVGKIGEKLKVTANFDNNTSFDFQNDLKVEYTGFEEDIIKKIEIGNVNLSVNNSLMRGSQNLFGIKTQFQFGKLYMTNVLTTQRGSSDGVTVEGGVQLRDFELTSADYDENRFFFLGHFFRDNYNRWLSSLPQIISRVNINRLEVYVLNRNSTTETLRNFAAFMDLGEGRVIAKPDVASGGNAASPASNDANELLDKLNGSNFRNANEVSGALEGIGLEKGSDFAVIRGARKLDEREYSYNSQLGYITMFRKLQNDEVLAVAYEYSYEGRNYKVGELTDEYGSRPEDQVIFLKLLRPNQVNTMANTWDLMMKNVYTLNASQISQESFQLRIIYRDDETGQDNPSLNVGINTKDVPLVELFGLDQLNQLNDPQPDGNFDFVDGLTINSETGSIVFPVLEPFGSDLERLFEDSEQGLKDRFVFNDVYNTTKADAEQNVLKNKFFLKGQFLAGSSNEIVLPGINIAENSVSVTAGNTILTEGVHYRVDYNLGKVIIIDESILISGKQINIDYEKADLFSFQTRSLMGTRFDYKFNDDVNLGATVLYLNERPLITRTSIGDEPVRNLKWGLDLNYRKESKFLTKMVDALPLIQTKEPSMVTFNAEFAQLLPGTSNKKNGKGISFLDDFEAAVTPFALGNPQSWKLASTPSVEGDLFNGSSSDLEYNFKRAKIAWYIIDNVFYRSNDRNRPDNIETTNNYVRQISPQEIFRERDEQVVNTNLPIMDIAYFPSERGPYNYNPNLDAAGFLEDPASNWGGVTRAITSDVDFDKTNIEFIEFWLLDPFLPGTNGIVQAGYDGIPNYSDQNNTDTQGKLVFNLGNVSEDFIPDQFHGFENGLPPDGGDEQTSPTPWGKVTTQQYLTNAFDNSTTSRENQDVGFDGLADGAEAIQFQDFLNQVPASVRAQVSADPSADNFIYYLNTTADQENQQVLQRYKNFNNPENNSPVATNNNQNFVPAGSNFPDNEDLNTDNTISDLEGYYEYSINLNRTDLQVGRQNIVDAVTAPTPSGDNVTWYLFRIPIREPDRKQGTIDGFKTIRYVRSYLTGFTQPIVLRMGDFQLVGSQWRRYTESLEETGFFEDRDTDDPSFTVSVVSDENNPSYEPPPGFERDRDNTSTIERRLNEQALQLCVDDLADRDGRAVFKNVNFDLINYRRLQMFIHAESPTTRDNEVSAFLRIGTDFTQNYYEVEIPLLVSPDTPSDPREIWPLENEIDLAIDEFYTLKSERNQQNADLTLPFPQSGPKQVGRHRIRVKGNPDMSSVYALMLGIRNPESADGAPKSVCVWTNELRVSDFDQTAGWAANASLNLKLADFAVVNASVRHTTLGFGSIQDKISDRTREETTEFDISANVNLDKLIPAETGLQIPMFVSYENTRITPEFDPRDPDITVKTSLTARSPSEADRYRKIIEERSTFKSINFTNVRKVKIKPEAKSRIYDIENLTFTFAHSELSRSNHETESYAARSTKAAIAYNFAPKETSFAPFQNSEGLKSPYLQLIKDFNISPLPSNISFRADVDRRFVKTQLWGVDRNNNLTTLGVAPYFEKYFTFNRIYSLRWNLTQNLSLDYSARANAVIDEPEGDLDTEAKRDQVRDNLKSLGRLKNYDQTIGLNYKLPLDKIPLTDWISADLNYNLNYSWTSGAFNPSQVVNQKDSLGNIIQNSRDRNITSRIDLVGLYNKNKFLQKLNAPPARNSRPRAKADEEADGSDTTDIKRPDYKLFKGLARLLMSVRSVSVTYGIREGTILPGFLPDAHLFGMDRGWNAPGLPFILGSQNLGIKDRAVSNNWIAPSPFLTQPFGQSNTIDLNISARLEPVRDLKIDVTMRKLKSANYQEIFRFNDAGTDVESFNPSRNGAYSISFLSLKTAFSKDDNDNVSPVFQEFESNIGVIRDRLAQENTNSGGSYGDQSQDILIPAFIAAYTGKDANTINLSPFPKTPLPNWRLDYAGLSKIPALSEVFSAVNLTHSYTSNFDVANFNNAGDYIDPFLVDLTNDIEDYPFPSIPNQNGEWIPVFVLNQVAITERFAPLIGLNLRTKSRMDIRLEYRKERNLALQLSNAQLTELRREDFVLGFGYRKQGFKIPFKVKGKTVTLENDLSFQLDFAIGDSQTLQRKINDVSTVTSGNLNFQLSPSVSYVVNDRLNVQVYFERNINEPKVTNSFKRATTRFGVQLSFSLAQ